MTKILKVDGTIEKINKKRSRMTLAAGSKKIEGRIAGATKITIKGKKAERRALGIGMSCSISLVSSGAVVSQMSCK
jgi:hypothetical protein